MAKRSSTTKITRIPEDRLRAGWIVAVSQHVVIEQSSETNCGPACAQMLFADRGLQIDQAQISSGFHVPCEAKPLADRLNQLSPLIWLGGYYDLPITSQAIESLLRKGSWAALMELDGASTVGHWIIVDDVDLKTKLLQVRDPVGRAYLVPFAKFKPLWEFGWLVIER